MNRKVFSDPRFPTLRMRVREESDQSLSHFPFIRRGNPVRGNPLIFYLLGLDYISPMNGGKVDKSLMALLAPLTFWYLSTVSMIDSS